MLLQVQKVAIANLLSIHLLAIYTFKNLPLLQCQNSEFEVQILAFVMQPKNFLPNSLHIQHSTY